MNKQVILSLEVAKQMYSSNNDTLKAFALENYTKDELTKKELPKSFEELNKITGYYASSNDGIIRSSGFIHPQSCQIINVYPTKELCKASIALAKLLHLRDVYRQGWIPDYNNYDNKFSILIYRNSINTEVYISTNKTLSFQSATIRNQFLNNFRSLIEEAKELL